MSDEMILALGEFVTSVGDVEYVMFETILAVAEEDDRRSRLTTSARSSWRPRGAGAPWCRPFPLAAGRSHPFSGAVTLGLFGIVHFPS